MRQNTAVVPAVQSLKQIQCVLTTRWSKQR